MSNPIQQVLEAEKHAQRAVLDARAAAASAVSQTEQWARDLQLRTERRLKQAAANYEHASRVARENRSAVLRQSSEELTQRQSRDIEQHLDEMVRTAFAEFWPAG